MATSIYADWIQKAQTLSTGQSIYIQTETKDEQKLFLAAINKELKALKEIDPMGASTLIASKVFKDSRHWVILKRAAADPFVGFLKNPDGKIERIILSKEDEKYRRFSLMIEDGWTREEIEQEENIVFTEEEIKILWPKLRTDSLATSDS